MSQKAVPFRRLLAPGSLAESLGVYVGATAIQKAMGVGRMLLFVYLMGRCAGQLSYWGLGGMILAVAAPVLGFGANHGLLRYVSLYEARGQLRRFYRGLALPLCALTLAAGTLALLASKPIADMALASQSQAGQEDDQLLGICVAALANGILLALFNNMLAVMYALRTYRLASAIELLFTVLFTAFSAAVLFVSPTGMAALLCHLVALTITAAVGAVLLHVAIERICTADGTAAPESVYSDGATELGQSVVEPGLTLPEPVESAPPPHEPVIDSPVPQGRFGMLARVLAFGLPAMVGNLLWNALSYISFWITYRYAGEMPADLLFAWMSLAQIILFAANAAWAVVFTHVARRWESDRRDQAMLLLETACKALAVANMTISALLYVSAPLWMNLLPAELQGGVEMLGDLLVFFLVLSNLSIVSILSRLHERPIVIAICAVVGGAAVGALAYLWRGDGAQGAALAAALGLYFGGGAVALAYAWLARVRLSIGVYMVLAMPAIFLLPAPMAAIAWLAILAATVLTPTVFGRQQKQALREFAGNSWLSLKAKVRSKQ